RYGASRPLIEERGPGRFPELAAACGNLALDAPVARDDGQSVPAAHAAGVKDVRAVGRNRRRLVELAAAQHLQGALLRVYRTDAVCAAVERDDGQRIAVGGDARARVVAPVIGDAARTCTRVEADCVDLRRAGPVRREIER